MPSVNNIDLYRAVFNSAKKLFANPDLLKPHIKVLVKGTLINRYTNYRNGPQTENSCRKIWLSLANDLDNRWTGNGHGVSSGSQGLYCTANEFHPGKPFPAEMEHYMNPEDPDTAGPVPYYDTATGKNPTKVTVDAKSLRSVFLFTAKQDIPILDFSLYGGLPAQLHKMVKQDSPNVVPANKTLEDLYADPNDSSWTKAAGNAYFETTDGKAFQTTSVRDGESLNYVFKGKQGETIDFIEPAARFTAYCEEQDKDLYPVKEVCTIADLQYNGKIQKTDLADLPPKDTQMKMLEDVATGAATKLSTDFQKVIELNPPTEATQKVARRLETITDHFKGQEMSAALTEMNQLSTEIAQLPKKDLVLYETKALQTVQITIDSLSIITASLNSANQVGSGNIDPKQDSVVDPPEEMLPETLEGKPR